MTDQPQIWLELPKVDTKEAAQLHCDLANQMLNRLGVKGTFFWASDKQRYCNTFYNCNASGHPGAGYTELSDRGQWFNLAFLATGHARVEG